MLSSICARRRCILAWVKFRSRVLTALNLLPSIATLASLNSSRRRHSTTNSRHTSRMALPFTAQVTENVFDSPTGHFLLVPQGTRLIGIYDSQVAFGQSRVLLVWTRLIMPNGRSIVLERQPGADTAGYAGLEDEVDNHWVALFKAALLSTLLGVGSELGSTTGTGTNGDVITALRRGSSDSLNQTGQKVVQQNLNIQPTLTVRPGFPVRVIVNRDLVLEPYKGSRTEWQSSSSVLSQTTSRGRY